VINLTVKQFVELLETLDQDKDIKIIAVGSDNNATTLIKDVEIAKADDCYKILVDG